MGKISLTVRYAELAPAEDAQPHLDQPGRDHQDRADHVADGQLSAFP